MTFELLKWIASGMIALVLTSTLWMAHTVRPAHEGPAVLMAQVAPVAAAAASAPVTTAR
ncbi:hypothetical protein [Roseateles sp.]|uniref:hypothetical protein n=1 Tax=Roseateles sp. TaxID=1971397 RepID=UPI003BAC6D82